MSAWRTAPCVLMLCLLAAKPAGAADDDYIDLHIPLPSTALVLTKQAQGSGFVIDRGERLLVTNHHVLDGRDEVQVIFPVLDNGRAFVKRDFYLTKGTRIKGKVLGSDAKLDLALIQLNAVPTEVPALRLATASPQAGDKTHIVANPGTNKLAWVYGVGSVRDVSKQKLEYQNGQKVGARIIELKADGQMAPGSSGGPVVNNGGELIGVLCAGAKGGAELWCIDISEVRHFLGETYRKQGSGALRKGEYSLAISHCERAIQFNPDDPLNHNERGAALSYLDRYDEAIQSYTTALKLDAKLARAHRNRGSAYFYKGQYEEAVTDCTAAIKLDPKYGLAYQTRAKALAKLNKPDEAKADAAKAKELSAPAAK